MEKRFKALRFVGTVYKIIGIIVGVITIVGAIGFCALSAIGGSALNSMGSYYGYSGGATGLFSGLVGGILGGGFILLYGGIMAITTYAAGEVIYLFLAMEENTRTTALMLQQRSG